MIEKDSNCLSTTALHLLMTCENTLLPFIDSMYRYSWSKHSLSMENLGVWSSPSPAIRGRVLYIQPPQGHRLLGIISSTSVLPPGQKRQPQQKHTWLFLWFFLSWWQNRHYYNPKQPMPGVLSHSLLIIVFHLLLTSEPHQLDMVNSSKE